MSGIVHALIQFKQNVPEVVLFEECRNSADNYQRMSEYLRAMLKEGYRWNPKTQCYTYDERGSEK